MMHGLRAAGKVLLSILVLMFSIPVHATAQDPRTGGPVPKSRVASTNVRFAAGQNALKIPIELSKNLILLQVRVNDSQPLWFVFDTGANTSVIDARLANELKLQTRGRVGGTGGGGKFIVAELIPGVSLAVPGATVLNQTIAALPIDMLSAVLGKRISGIVGYDFIKQFAVEIDYAAKVINLYSPATFKPPVAAEFLPVKFVNGKAFVSARVKLEGRDAIEGNFMIDTGADGAMNLNAPFVKTNGLLKSLPAARTSMSAGAGGSSKSFVARVQNIQIGRFVIADPLVELAQAGTEADTLTSYAGDLGGEIFRRFTLILDYPRQRIILEPNAHLAERIEADMSGLDLMAGGGDLRTLVINEVAKGSPGAEADLKEGDMLVAIDGHPVSELGLDQVRQMFKQDSKEYSLSIQRSGQTLPIKIKLRRLI